MILAIDPSSRRYGICIFSIDDRGELITHKTYSKTLGSNGNFSWNKRLHLFNRDMEKIKKEFIIDEVIYESPRLTSFWKGRSVIRGYSVRIHWIISLIHFNFKNVYSINNNTWYSKLIKKGWKNDPTIIRKEKSLEVAREYRTNNKKKYHHDESDSICLALFWSIHRKEYMKATKIN